MTKKKTTPAKLDPSELHKCIIDSYYSNGFNGRKAVLEHCPELSENSASVTWNTIQKRKSNKPYIDEKRARLKTQTDIQNENILRELINWAYVDATDYIGLEPSQIKELPADVRRCIQSYKTRSHYDKEGNYNGTTVELKLIDKTKAVEMINKHIGFYEADNGQKASKINLTKVGVDHLNVLLQAIEEKD